MPLTRLQIQNFRNLASVDLEPNSGINIIQGENGSGKTSLLEAISVLLHGRSFRTNNYRRLINDESDQSLCFGRVDNAIGVKEIGVKRNRDGSVKIRVNGETLNSSSELAQILPLQLINSDSFQVLEGQAKVRRKLFDWLVFHVKHDFKDVWNQYRQGLKQRNALLRIETTQYKDLEPWDVELSRLAERIKEMRDQCLEPLSAALNGLISKLDKGLDRHGEIVCRYLHGWDSEKGTLLEQNRTNFLRDMALGYSSLGPQRSEFKLAIDKRGPVQDFLSRGQQKTLIAAFHIAEIKVLKDNGIAEVALLVDDMPSELDFDNTLTLCNWLIETGCQSFISCIIPDSILAALGETKAEVPQSMFHVKHGCVEPA